MIGVVFGIVFGFVFFVFFVQVGVSFFGFVEMMVKFGLFGCFYLQFFWFGFVVGLVFVYLVMLVVVIYLVVCFCFFEFVVVMRMVQSMVIFWFVFQFGWCNFWCNKCCMGIMFVVIVVGVWVMIFVMVFLCGMVDQMLCDGICVLFGYVQIYYFEFCDDLSVVMFIVFFEVVLFEVFGDEVVSLWMSWVCVFVVVLSECEMCGVILVGIDLVIECDIFFVVDDLSEGCFFEDGEDKGFVLGCKLVECFEMGFGKCVVVMLQMLGNDIVECGFCIVGFFELEFEV